MGESSKDFEKMGVDFQTTLKDFIGSVEGLSKNSLKRVCNALAAYPLEEDLVELFHENEKNTYELGKSIQSIKINMMVESLKLDAEAQNKE